MYVSAEKQAKSEKNKCKDISPTMVAKGCPVHIVVLIEWLYYTNFQSVIKEQTLNNSIVIVAFIIDTFCILLQSVQTLIRRRVLRRLIWVYTVCQCPFYGTLGINELIKHSVAHTKK